MSEHEWMRDPEGRREGLVCRWCGMTEAEAEYVAGGGQCASAGIVDPS